MKMIEQPKSNILKALEGEAITTNQPESRILAAIKNGSGGGGGTPYDDTEIKQRLDALENTAQTQRISINTLNLSQGVQNDAIARANQNIAFILDYLGQNEYIDLAENQAVRLFGADAAIDTGLTLDGNYTIESIGCTIEGQQSILVGAYYSTKARAMLKILGGSYKLQSMWALNSEFEPLPEELNLFRPFKSVQNKDLTQIYQGENYFEINNSGYSDTMNDIAFYLFNQTESKEKTENVVFKSVKFTHPEKETVLFKPMIKRNIATGVEILVLTKNGAEMPLNNGYLEIVTFN